MRGGCLIKGPTPLPATLLSQNLNVQQLLWPMFTVAKRPYIESSRDLESVTAPEAARTLIRRSAISSLRTHRFPAQNVRRVQGICKMAKSILRLLVIAVVLNVAACQTFQYSRGWTNGKRSNDFATLSIAKLLDLPTHSVDLRTTETVSTFCCEDSCSTKKAVALLKTNGKSQLYLVPCDLLHARRRNMNEEKVQDTAPADGHFRRSLSTEYDSNNDNY
ncbi:uncharacterized protein Crz [Venturia canescens]|uniref:uncharacterized protein Crz n=1 Tax=Venturia canescens TaxID=32260 RepID=UPI001C9C302E|nr:uncharacterized protein LOC122408953 [Venturia canescens]